ncbi:hypothetical protein [Mycolicibacterium sp.]|uniref:hypothetical protein n=1 Tax=Mycolicibacterium sp. TaxID=2320850 RepID=UPI0028B12EF3|nr:hypothetical protein [Mycolicibacterium sp.]
MTNSRLFKVASAAFFLYWAVSWMGHALQSGSYATFLAEAATVLGILGIAVAGRMLRRIPAAQKWQLGSDSRGTVVGPNRVRVAVTMTSAISLMLGPFVIGLLEILGRLDLPLHDPPRVRERLLLGLFVVMGMVCGVYALRAVAGILRRRGDAGSLILNQRGLALSVGRSGEVSWDAINDVPPVGAATSNFGFYESPDLIVEASPAPLKLPLGMFPADAQRLADMVWFYWQHPDYRDELGTDRALARWQARDFHAMCEDDPDASWRPE